MLIDEQARAGGEGKRVALHIARWMYGRPEFTRSTARPAPGADGFRVPRLRPVVPGCAG